MPSERRFGQARSHACPLRRACPRVLQCQIGRTECPGDPTSPLRAFRWRKRQTRAPRRHRGRGPEGVGWSPGWPCGQQSRPKRAVRRRSEPTRRGHVLTATRSTVGPVSTRPRSVHRVGSETQRSPVPRARPSEHVTAGALRASVQRARRTDLRARTRARAGPSRPTGAAPGHRRPAPCRPRRPL